MTDEQTAREEAEQIAVELGLMASTVRGEKRTHYPDPKVVRTIESALLSRGRRERAQGMRDQWQPIETAPVQKTVVVGITGKRLRCTAMFIGACWRHPHSDDPICFEPSHWQPLPDPPEHRAGETEGQT